MDNEQVCMFVFSVCNRDRWCVKNYQCVGREITVLTAITYLPVVLVEVSVVDSVVDAAETTIYHHFISSLSRSAGTLSS